MEHYDAFKKQLNNAADGHTLTVETSPYEDQKPGTSGLRKKVTIYSSGLYTHNFVQSIFNQLPKDKIEGGTFLVSGDGRYYSEGAIRIIAGIAAGNKVKRLLIGKNGLCSTPAASAIVRERVVKDGVNQRCTGAFILTASHNPGGPDGDFGIKYNVENGGSAAEEFTNAVFETSKIIKKFNFCKLPTFSLDKLTTIEMNKSAFSIEIIDPVEDYMKIMHKSFDFPRISKFIHDKKFKVIFDGMNGVAGVYAKHIFVDTLKAGDTKECLINCTPKPDFGGLHPDPNLTYAKELVDKMCVLKPEDSNSITPDFGAAADGDADRNIILGKGFFVTPSDSLAIITLYANKAIPYFKDKKIMGVARSMPTATSVDKVANKMGIQVYETPTGWKFFCNLLDSKKIVLCGEESFGTGSDHIREKDGIWAVLAWLSVLEYHNRDTTALVGVKDIVQGYWKEFGRNFYVRYDYENVESNEANALVAALRNIAQEFKCKKNAAFTKNNCSDSVLKFITNNAVTLLDDFEYNDIVDKSVSPNQGIRLIFKDSSRVIIRLSGTGSCGATVRLYIEKYTTDSALIAKDSTSVLKDIAEFAVDFIQVEKFTKRTKPTVIT